MFVLLADSHIHTRIDKYEIIQPVIFKIYIPI